MYQVWPHDAWFRHITVAILAHACLAVHRRDRPKDMAVSLIPLTLGQIRRFLAHLTQMLDCARTWA